jgi:hypothetical protein
MQCICYLGSHLPRFAPVQNNLFKITIKRFILPRCAQLYDTACILYPAFTLEDDVHRQIWRKATENQ